MKISMAVCLAVDVMGIFRELPLQTAFNSIGIVSASAPAKRQFNLFADYNRAMLTGEHSRSI